MQRFVAHIADLEGAAVADLPLDPDVPFLDVRRADVRIESPWSRTCECGCGLGNLRLPRCGRREIGRQQISERQRAGNEIAEARRGGGRQAQRLVEKGAAAGTECPEI